MPILVSGVCYTVHREVSGDVNFVMKNLHHFSRYSIKVIACRELDASEMTRPEVAQNCSPAAIIQQRTLHKGIIFLCAKLHLSPWAQKMSLILLCFVFRFLRLYCEVLAGRNQQHKDLQMGASL